MFICINSAYLDKSSTGVNPTPPVESKRLFIVERDQEEFERDLKDHYNTAFTPNYGLDQRRKAHNQSTISDHRDDTIISNRSVPRKKGGLNKTVDYGTIAHDDESFFRAIDDQIKDLDMKIHKTKKDISNIKNTSEPNMTIAQLNSNSSRLIPDVVISTPMLKAPSHFRQNSLTKPPLGQGRGRPTSQESRNSNDGSTMFAKKERENNKLYDLPIDPYGRVNSEDSEPQRPGSKHRVLLPSMKLPGSERGGIDGHESPLFDIAQDIEKKQTANPTPQPSNRGMGNFILVNDNINTIKEEPNEERRNSTVKRSGRDSQNAPNSRRSNNSQQRTNADEKSVEQQIAEVQKTLEGYKKELKPSSREGGPPTTNSRGNNSGRRMSKEVNKKSQSAIQKPDESKEEKIDNYLKYFE